MVGGGCVRCGGAACSRGGAWKRRRYSAGPTSSVRRNTRRIVSAVPKPQPAAIAAIGSSVSSSRRRAASRRTRSTWRAGVTPVSARKARAKWRGLMWARAAIASTRVIAGDVLEHRPLDLAQRLALGPLGDERGAELGLVAGAAQEQHEVTRDRERGLPVEVLLDERQREVHPGGDPGRGPDRAVAHEDRLGVDAHLGMQALQLVRGRPVRGRAAAVEQARAGEQERAGAHRGRASGRRSRRGRSSRSAPGRPPPLCGRIPRPGSACRSARMPRAGRRRGSRSGRWRCAAARRRD